MNVQEKPEVKFWRHVDTKSNPADLATRGSLTSELIENKFWLHGPSWLVLPESQWPASKFAINETPEQIRELKVHSVVHSSEMITNKEESSKNCCALLAYTSKLEKALNIISYANRFIKMRCNKKERETRMSVIGRITVKIIPPTEEEKADAMA